MNPENFGIVIGPNIVRAPADQAMSMGAVNTPKMVAEKLVLYYMTEAEAEPE